MLSLAGVNAFYGSSKVLHDVALEVPEGGILAVLGRNGVGKTSLLKTIMGLTDRHDGSIRLGGTELAGLPTHRRARSGLGYVPQGRQIIPDFSVRENILMGGFAAPAGRRRVPEIVEQLFPYLRDNLSRRGGLLSGGQQQQLAIARALAAEPKLLLLDEPTEGIQPNLVAQIQDSIRLLNRELGLTIVLVEQNVAFARAACRRFVVLEKGRVAAAGDPEQLTDALVEEFMTV